MGRNEPLVFTAGHGASIIPARFSAIGQREKPINMTAVIQAISRALQH